MAAKPKVSLIRAKERYGDGVSSRSSTVAKIRSARGLAPLTEGSAAPARPVTPQ